MKVSRGKGDTAPTHSWSRSYMVWVVSVTFQPRFTLEERTSGTHWIGGVVGLSAGLDSEARGKILCLCRGSNRGHPVCSETLHWLSYPSSNSLQGHELFIYIDPYHKMRRVFIIPVPRWLCPVVSIIVILLLLHRDQLGFSCSPGNS
jgi:hypothetical protein